MFFFYVKLQKTFLVPNSWIKAYNLQINTQNYMQECLLDSLYAGKWQNKGITSVRILKCDLFYFIFSNSFGEKIKSIFCPKTLK